ncbi:hypothetical protein [Bacteroides nordii]|uniref:hypothetical protein n=1 Tax=Bacteroides nordii TaxID=291645 RepID=UPI002A7F0F84|nr:hypothetical protein [Bacteroides nordii]
MKHPSGSFDISFAHCSACGPVIVVSMLENTCLRTPPKGPEEALPHISCKKKRDAPHIELSAGRGDRSLTKKKK